MQLCPSLYENAVQVIKALLRDGFLAIFDIALGIRTNKYQQQVSNLVEKSKAVQTGVELAEMLVTGMFSAGFEIFSVTSGKRFDSEYMDLAEPNQGVENNGVVPKVMCTIDLGLRSLAQRGRRLAKHALLKPKVLLA